MIELHTPIPKTEVRKLRIGDTALLSGTILTARDMAHKYLIDNKPPELVPVLKRGIIYHCGPIVKQAGRKFTIVSAGPTTSMRQELYQTEVIKRWGISAIVGKGGMGEKTRRACKRFGTVYLEAVGGNAAALAQTVKNVQNVFCLSEFGMPEAMWLLEVEYFPTIVTIDTTGADLHENVRKKSAKERDKLLK